MLSSQSLHSAACVAGSCCLVRRAPPRRSCSIRAASRKPRPGSETHELATAKRHMVSAANALAAEAGREMLRAGGSAIDAAIATQLVLNIVEPQSSGIGGGAFILYWDKAKSELKVYDGRETAPASARPTGFSSTASRCRSTTPCCRGSASACRASCGCWRTCTSSTASCRGPSCSSRRSASPSNGFEISQRLHFLLRLDGPASFVPAARRYFFTDGGSALPDRSPAEEPGIRRDAAAPSRPMVPTPSTTGRSRRRSSMRWRRRPSRPAA